MKVENGVRVLADGAEWENEQAQGDKLVVLDMSAEWCGPCKVIAPTVHKLVQNYPDTLFYQIDVDEAPELAQSLGVRAMPTFFFFKNGQKLEQVVGANPVALEAAVKKFQ